MKYDEYMDDGVEALCDRLNALPGVATFSSCNGHFRSGYHVAFYCLDRDTLALLSRSVSPCYNGGFWELAVGHTDIPPCLCFELRHPMFADERQMEKEVERLIGNIDHAFGDGRVLDYVHGRCDMKPNDDVARLMDEYKWRDRK